jgi:putative membrane protein
MKRRGLLTALAAVLAAAMLWTFLSAWTEIAALGRGVGGALWTLALIVPVHLFQLFLSGAAWNTLFAGRGPGLATCFRLRLVREGIDSLLPVAQIGGEVIGARMLARTGTGRAASAASVVVDVSLEVLAQAIFLVAGIAALAILAGGAHWAEWGGSLVLAAGGAGGFLLAQRFGLLWLLEMLTDRIGGKFPGIGNLSLDGLHTAAGLLYRRKRAIGLACLLHTVSWSFGAVESWIVLRALGAPASLPQAFVIESLGLAARTAGFAIPGALAVQEGGFALAAMSVGLPDSAGLALSLVKRAREVLVGAAGVTLGWSAGGFR